MKTRRILPLVLGISLFASCTEEVPFDLNEQGFDRIVVEGSITDQEKAHQVKLTRTTSYFNDQNPPVVAGAFVTISNGTDSWELAEIPSGSGLYYTPPDAAGTVGLDHTLTIEADGETYTAVDYMNPTAVIDSMAVEFEEFEDDVPEDGYWAIKLWTVERPGTQDFYRWRTLINGVSDSDTLRFSSWTDDTAFDGAVVDGLEIDGFEEERIQIGDTVTLEQHGITQAYFTMIRAVIEQTEFQGGLFDPPPANIPTNVSNGALGFFSASAVSEWTTVVE